MKSVMQVPQVSIRRRRAPRGGLSAASGRAADAGRHVYGQLGRVARRMPGRDERASDLAPWRQRKSYVIVGVGVTTVVIGAWIARARSQRRDPEDDVRATDEGAPTPDGPEENAEPTRQPDVHVVASEPAAGSDEAASA